MLDYLEEELHSEAPEDPAPFPPQPARVTRGVNISQKYASLLSRKYKEQTQTRSLEMESSTLQTEKKVIFIPLQYTEDSFI